MKHKTKSSIKKRFKQTGTGKVMGYDIGQQDRMLHKRRCTLKKKGVSVLSNSAGKVILKYLGNCGGLI